MVMAAHSTAEMMDRRKSNEKRAEVCVYDDEFECWLKVMSD